MTDTIMNPDLSTLPQRMRYAAAVMREAAARETAEGGRPSLPVYSANHFEWMADRWEPPRTIKWITDNFAYGKFNYFVKMSQGSPEKFDLTMTVDGEEQVHRSAQGSWDEVHALAQQWEDQGL
jgi:hypothetical protein